MIEESALVVACDDEGYATVETQVRAACGSCSASSGCGTSVVAGLFKRRRNRLRVRNPIQAMPGQQVVVGLQEHSLVSASLMAYLLPLVCLILGAIAAQEAARYLDWSAVELVSIAGGLLGLFGGFALLRRFSRHTRQNPNYQAVILRRDIGEPIQLNLG